MTVRDGEAGHTFLGDLLWRVMLFFCWSRGRVRTLEKTIHPKALTFSPYEQSARTRTNSGPSPTRSSIRPFGPFHNLGLVALVPLSKRWRPGTFQTWRTSAIVEGGSTVFNLRPGRGTKPVRSSAFYTIIGASSWISLTYYHAAQVTQQLVISGILVLYSFIVLFWSSLSTRY